MKDTNPKTIYGKAKPSISLIPGTALLHIANAFKDGAEKYGPANWRDDPVSTTTYIDACYRHILAYADGGEQYAEDSGVHHLGHAAACLAILLDAEEQGTLVDDRPTAGRTPRVIKELTRPWPTGPTLTKAQDPNRPGCITILDRHSIDNPTK